MEVFGLPAAYQQHLALPQFQPRGKSSADIRSEIAELTDAAQVILDRVGAEERDITDAELATFDGHLAALKPLQAELSRVEANEARKQGIAEAQSIISTPYAGVRGANYGNGSMTPAAQVRHVPPRMTAFKNTAEGQRDAWIAANWWKAIRTGDAAATQVVSSAGFDVRMTATEGNPGAGGYLVPTPLSNTIIEVRAAAGVMRRLAQIVPMTSETHSEPKLLSGPTVTYPGEAGEFTASDESWGQVALVAKKRGILTKVSRELRDDALISVIDQLASRMGHEFALKEDAEGINGDATSTYGGVAGLLNRLGTAGVATADSGDSTWDTLDLNDFTRAMGLLPSKYVPNAAWVCSSNFYFSCMLRALADAGGNTMLSLAQGVDTGLFLGKPVYFTDQMVRTTAVSTVSALYGDFNAAMMLGDRQGVEIVVSDQRYFEFDLVGVRGVSRYDLNVHEPGSATANDVGAYVGLKTAAS